MTASQKLEAAENPNYEKDINHVFGLSRGILKLIGVWSLVEKQTSTLERVVSFLVRVTLLCVQAFFVIPICMHIFFVEQNPIMKIKLFGPPSNCAFTVIKFFCMVFNGTAIGRCIEHMKNDWKRVQNPQHRDIMLKQISISKNLTILCFIFIYTAGISYYTIIPYMNKHRLKGNYTMRKLAHPGYDRFFDIKSSPTFELIYFAHLLSGFFRYNVTAASFSLTVIFVTHVCGQIQIQLLRLKELYQENSKRNGPDPLAVIIRDHGSTLQLASDFRESLNELLLTEIFGCTFSMCLAEYCCLMEWNDMNPVAITTYLIYCTSFSFNAMIFCYIGELLTEECSQVGFASYDVSWYNLPSSKASGFILLNLTSLFPPNLVAGKVMKLSMNTFSVIVKTTVVYLNLLRTVTNI
ncbi:uncharacterized protein LOC143352957 isoform X1 [Halictus rubicundus]|uniref:uncharacterized protein LOC143352957 isoform X1 n=1 Tax=Halictus rubicundus TaxID=77578 RepID=UPI004037244A